MSKEPGIRIRHATLRDGMGLIQEPIAIEPYLCPRCLPVYPAYATHEFKTHHVMLDAEGFGIVSPVVWAIIQRQPNAAGFVMINEVADPPPIRIHTGMLGQDKGVLLDGKPTNPRVAGGRLVKGDFDG